jgi:predicted ATPase
VDKRKDGFVSDKFHTNYEIRWKNYRRFEDTGWLTIKPLTILLGANNGGKSSVLSPLLLLAQTLASTDREVPLLPFGPLIDLGSYKDFVHLHQTERDIFFGVRFHTHKSRKKLKPVGEYPPGGIELTFGAGESADLLRLKRIEVTDIYNRPYFSREATKDGFSLEGPMSLGAMKSGESRAIGAAEPFNFLFSPNDVLYELNNEAPKDQEAKRETFSKDFSHYLRAIGFTYRFVCALLDDLSYVGPLRAKLSRFYRVSPEKPETVGSQGEHAANLFRRRKSLKPEVDAWVKRFEFGDELRCSELTDDLFQLVFKSGDEQTNVADAGFGASQVLPLIVQAVAAPHDSLTIAEQPEIHLNPRLQCILADLFVEMAMSGHRIVVETHSEHLIVSLRRLVAEGRIDPDLVGLYFVERSSAASSIREIPVSANGNIDRQAWPAGFFEDGLREALALATAQSKHKVAKKRARKASNADS